MYEQDLTRAVPASSDSHDPFTLAHVNDVVLLPLRPL